MLKILFKQKFYEFIALAIVMEIIGSLFSIIYDNPTTPLYERQYMDFDWTIFGIISFFLSGFLIAGIFFISSLYPLISIYIVNKIYKIKILNKFLPIISAFVSLSYGLAFLLFAFHKVFLTSASFWINVVIMDIFVYYSSTRMYPKFT